MEPRYNQALDSVRAGDPDDQAIFTIAGFISYVFACSPAGMRISSIPMRAMVEAETKLLERLGKLPALPEAFGDATLEDLLNHGAITVDVDPKYPQAIGIGQILDHVATFGNFPWEFLINPYQSSPFFTSDFPIALEPSVDPRVSNKLVPLAPDLAVRIFPDPRWPDREVDTSFEHFRLRLRTPSENEVRELNRRIVRAAESEVYFRDNHPWVRRFVERNRNFRTDVVVSEIPTSETGRIIHSSQRVLPHNWDEA